MAARKVAAVSLFAVSLFLCYPFQSHSSTDVWHEKWSVLWSFWRPALTSVPAWQLALRNWAYNCSYFPQLGLWRDDCRYETPEVKQALERLPKDVLDQRSFRMIRALQLSGQKKTLPRSEWTKLEDDELYLKPYLEDVQKENAEKWEWSKQ